MQFEVEVAAGFTGPVELADGRLFALDADLKALYSTDGRAWGRAGADEVPLFDVGAPGVRLKPMSIVRLASGGLIMNYWEPVSRPAGTREFRTCVRWSHDEGATWSDPVEVTPPGLPAYPTYLLQMSSGRLLLPNEYAFKQDSRNFRHNSMKVCTVFYSDDEGETWEESVDGGFVGEADRGANASFVEAPCLAETSDGRLLLFMRTQMQRIAQSYSEDGGVHWEQGCFNDLVSSCSEIWIDRLPDSGNLLCVWNQVSEAEILSGYYRSRLSSAISSDSGATWEQFRTIVQTAGMATVDRLEPAEPALALSSGVSPDRGPYPPGGHYTYRHPRVRFIGDHAYLRVDARCYDAPGSRVSYGDRLWVMPVGWFYGED